MEYIDAYFMDIYYVYSFILGGIYYGNESTFTF